MLHPAFLENMYVRMMQKNDKLYEQSRNMKCDEPPFLVCCGIVDAIFLHYNYMKARASKF